MARHGRREPETRHRLVARVQAGVALIQAARLGHPVEVRRRLDFLRDLIGQLLRLGLGLLQADLIGDLRAHFGERLGGGGLLVGEFDDVKSEL